MRWPEENVPHGAERFPALDMVRGFALLGIVLMNIVSFGLPAAAYVNPVHAGPVSTADMATWFLTATLVDGRMRALFAMLFGASMLMVVERLGVAAHLRRMLVLALIGLLHALFVWHGDILLPYALLGLLLFPATRMSAHSLGLMAVIAFTMQAMVHGFTGWHILKLEALAGTSPQAARMLLSWREALAPPPAEIAHEIDVLRGSYGGILRFRGTLLLHNWSESLPAYFLLETAGQMLAGMALMKTGFWQGALPRRHYRWLAATLLLAVPLSAAVALGWMRGGFQPAGHYGMEMFRVLIAPVMAIGYAALLIPGIGGRAARLLALCGRMSLSNYLLTSLIATGLFYGAGRFAAFSRTELWLPVLAIWAILPAFSALWLRHFRLGPAEGWWRMLAEGRGFRSHDVRN